MENSQKIFIVTGATSGIGKETARGLLQSGGKVVMIARNEQKASQTAQELTADTGSNSLDILLADLSLMGDVRKLAKSIIEKYPKIDVLINNAGVTYYKRILTKEGFETTFAVNHLAPFLLTNLLLDLLGKSAPSRIINVSSEMHKRGQFDPDDLQWAKGYSWSKSYCSSKLYNLLFTMELSKRLKGTGVTVNALHPGLVRTNIGSGQGFMSFMKRMVDTFAITPAEGAKTVIYLATSDEVANVTGLYFAKCRQESPKSKCLNAENASRLWDASSIMAGL